MIPMSHTSSFRSSACDCVCGFVFIITLTFLICATPAVFRLLILLQPTLPNFNTHSSNLSIINVSSDSDHIPITARWDLMLSIHNPNTKPLSYHQIEATSSLPNSRNFTTPIPSFAQKGKARESIQVAFTSMLLEFPNCSSTTAPDCGAVNLTMEVQARATYGGWTWPVKTDSIKVVCRQELKVQFPLINITTLNFDATNANTTCDVNGRWKTLVTNWHTLFWKYLYFVVIFLGILFVSL